MNDNQLFIRIIIYLVLFVIAVWGAFTVYKDWRRKKHEQDLQKRHSEEKDLLRREHAASISELIKGFEERLDSVKTEGSQGEGILAGRIEELEHENAVLKKELEYLRTEITSESAGFFGKKNVNLSDITMKLLIENYSLRSVLNERWDELKNDIGGVSARIDKHIKKAEESTKLTAHIHYTLMQNKAIQDMIVQEMKKGGLLEVEKPESEE